VARSVLPTWSSPRQACALVLTGATARTCLPVARVAANYAIPFCVSSYGALSAVRRGGPACPLVPAEQQAQHDTPPAA